MTIKIAKAERSGRNATFIGASGPWFLYGEPGVGQFWPTFVGAQVFLAYPESGVSGRKKSSLGIILLEFQNPPDLVT
jgi:hypothetical protein